MLIIFRINPASIVFSFAQTSLESVLETLKFLNPTKATCPDNIPSKVLKIAAEILPSSLTANFNHSLSMEIYPNDWKMARFLPVFKSGNIKLSGPISHLFQLYLCSC